MRKLFCIQILFVTLTSFAQTSADTSTVSGLHPVSIYYGTLGEQSPIFNAREYVAFPGIIHEGHPFYKTTEFAKGTIHYDGMIFEDAMILYDIITDKVLIRHYNGAFRIDLPVEKISEFRLLNHHFIRLFPDSAQVIKEGFYDKLYQGKMTLFVKRVKMFREERTGNDILRVVDEKDLFYIYRQGVFHSIRNKKALLKFFKDRRDEIKRRLKSQGIKFRKEREAAIVTAVKYYDSLSN